MEATDANVGDALTGVAEAVGRQLHFAGQTMEILLVEFHREFSKSGRSAQRTGQRDTFGIE